jgi:rhodanese-related sulfurtransferase
MQTAQELVAAAKADIKEVSLDDAENAVLLGSLVLDVREESEFLQGCIGGAVNIPRGLLEFTLSADEALHDRSRPIVVYCKGGGRAALAAKTLQEMGYVSVQSIAGGFDAWAAAGKATAHPPAVQPG